MWGTLVMFWYRYVDDVICLWEGPHTTLDEFLAFINSRYQSIEFSLEFGGSEINFLDLHITLNPSGFLYEVY